MGLYGQGVKLCCMHVCLHIYLTLVCSALLHTKYCLLFLSNARAFTDKDSVVLYYDFMDHDH